MARRRGTLWQADVRLSDGKRLRPTFKTEAEADAWEANAKLAVQMAKPLPPTVAVPRKASDRDLTRLGALFDHVARTEWSQMRSSTDLIRNGRHVVEYFGRQKVADEITAQDVSEMRAHFAEAGLAPATVNHKGAALSKLLNVGKDCGVVTSVPKFKWGKTEQTRFRFLDQLEERAVLAYWQAAGLTDFHDLTILLIDTGARCYSEMTPIKWDAFGEDFKTVTFWHTKTFKPRTIPLTDRCRKVLRERAKVKRKGPFEGFNKSVVKSRWVTMRDALHLHDVTPHTMRHTCCTRLVLGGVDVKRVMEWMGHSSIQTTMRYMQIRPTSLEEIVHILEAA